ncbi:hypothetical protein BJX99DRAFT_252757 [Aspergillus californicus]
MFSPNDVDVQALWNEHYSCWFPIIHHTFFDPTEQANPQHKILWKAMKAAVTLRVDALANDYRRALSRWLQDEVTAKAMSNFSLNSIQALLVICNLGYGEGETDRFLSLMAICQRMSLQIGLRDTCDTTIQDIQRATALHSYINNGTNPAIAREECIRTFWVVEMLDIISTTGSPYGRPSLSQPPLGLLPCRDSIWALSKPPPTIPQPEPLATRLGSVSVST